MRSNPRPGTPLARLRAVPVFRSVNGWRPRSAAMPANTASANSPPAAAAVQQNITYRRELLSGDIVAVRTGMLEMRDKVAKFVHEMRNAHTGEVAAICVLTGVHMDSVARKSTPFPPEIVERGRGMLCAYEGVA